MIATATNEYLAALFHRPPAGLWHRWDREPAVPEGVALGIEAHAYVNHGRWVVDCACGGAQLAHPDHDRFFCVDCLNEHAGGLWVQVVWPADSAEIENVLTPRRVVNQNWRGETLEELEAENDGVR